MIDVCLVFEPMDRNLLHLIKRYDYRGVPIYLVKAITQQVSIHLLAHLCINGMMMIMMIMIWLMIGIDWIRFLAQPV